MSILSTLPVRQRRVKFREVIHFDGLSRTRTCAPCQRRGSGIPFGRLRAGGIRLVYKSFLNLGDNSGSIRLHGTLRHSLLNKGEQKCHVGEVHPCSTSVYGCLLLEGRE